MSHQLDAEYVPYQLQMLCRVYFIFEVNLYDKIAITRNYSIVCIY